MDPRGRRGTSDTPPLPVPIYVIVMQFLVQILPNNRVVPYLSEVGASVRKFLDLPLHFMAIVFNHRNLNQLS